jgi:hypothetical protein
MRLSACDSWSWEVAMCESRRQAAVICHQPTSGESLPFRATHFSIDPSPAAMGHRSSRQGVQPIGDDTTFLHAAPPRHAPFLSAPSTTPRRHLSTTCCSAHNASSAQSLQAYGQMRRLGFNTRQLPPHLRHPATRASRPAAASAAILRPLVNPPPSARYSARWAPSRADNGPVRYSTGQPAPPAVG